MAAQTWSPSNEGAAAGDAGQCSSALLATAGGDITALKRHRRTYPRFWQWRENMVEVAMLKRDVVACVVVDN
jgi:hypothetical protein